MEKMRESEARRLQANITKEQYADERLVCILSGCSLEVRRRSQYYVVEIGINGYNITREIVVRSYEDWCEKRDALLATDPGTWAFNAVVGKKKGMKRDEHE